MNVRNWRESRSSYVFMKDVSRFPLLTNEEQDEMARRAAGGDESARECLVMSISRLAIKTARQWATPNLTEEDAIQAAMMGAVEAANRYEIGKGSFAAYGMHWVLMRLRRASVSARRAVKLPNNPSRYGTEVGAFVRQYVSENGCAPEPSELVDRFPITMINAQHAVAIAVTDASLNSVIRSSGRNQMELQDTIADEGPAPDKAAAEAMTSRMIARMMGCLDSREQEIIRRRFGLGGLQEETLEEIGRDIGLSRERVRQLQDGALDKMTRGERRATLVKDAKRAMQGYRHVA